MHGGAALGKSMLALGHAMAQALGGRYGLPHGALNAICLPAALRFNARGRPRRDRPASARRSAPRIRPAASRSWPGSAASPGCATSACPSRRARRGRRGRDRPSRRTREPAAGQRGARSRSCCARSGDRGQLPGLETADRRAADGSGRLRARGSGSAGSGRGGRARPVLVRDRGSRAGLDAVRARVAAHEHDAVRAEISAGVTSGLGVLRLEGGRRLAEARRSGHLVRHGDRVRGLGRPACPAHAGSPAP